MSRIGKRPIEIPGKVSIKIDGQHIAVKGPKGDLERILPELVQVTQEGNAIQVIRQDDSRPARERHGLARTLVANMVEGVSKGYEKRLQIQGVGYRAQVQGKTLVLNVGYSHPVEIEPPDGIEFAIVDKKTNEIAVTGISKEEVGNTAARIRAVRPPEVYKGKGIRYKGEFIQRKAGKAGKK
ncbi:MAG: 50S ribosomal protein L6 [Spirulina sp. SIO3F2]|nr:50S ribosomal protein L6 [Spirulina sp. SIO3F2]